ncbi:ABC transporter substrate-binding protein [Chitinasiproducens palmae]|nr:ABC transporter substrate-binding protein [Chitinasiproducens palmae]
MPLRLPLLLRFLSGRAVLSALLLAALSVASLIGVSPARAEVTLRVGYLRTQGYLADFPLAKVAIPGVRLELVALETGNDVLEALSAGAIDVGETGEVQPIFAQSAGQPIKVIASTAPQPTATAILVNQASPLHQVGDLRGKKISFVRGTNTHWLVIQSLGRVGLKQADIQPIFLGPADTVTALVQGQIGAATLTAPNIQIAEARGARVLVDGTGIVNSSIYYMASTNTIAGPKRNALGGFVTALDAHLPWIQSHLQERAAYLAPRYGVPPEIVLAASRVMAPRLVPVGDGKLAAYTQRIADAFAEQKLIPARIDARQEFDGSFDASLRK